MARFSANWIELSDDEQEETAAEQQRRGAIERMARRGAELARSCAERPQEDASRGAPAHRPDHAKGRAGTPAGAAAAPPRSARTRSMLLTVRASMRRLRYISLLMRVYMLMSMSAQNTKILNKIEKREQRSLWAVPPEERPALREQLRTWPSIGRYICDLLPSSKVTGPASHGCNMCFAPETKHISVVHLRCQHTFHRECVEEWLLHQDTCPLCDVPILEYK